ncbi:MAG: hypothetical protein JWP97_2831 [Labilithrix sp.]|nr:hypothetical protein [Labilithrix sp.]
MTQADPPDSLAALARGKLVRVLGEAPGTLAYQEALRVAKLHGIETPEDLHRFAAVLAGRGGMMAAVGSVLSVAAVLRGAGPR